MEIKINIPNDFTGDYIGDKFKDFFSRVIADIDNNGLCGNYEKETMKKIAEMFIKAFDKSEEQDFFDKAKQPIKIFAVTSETEIEAYGSDAIFGECPKCGMLQSSVWNKKYCGDCGQLLVWPDYSAIE